MPSKRRRIAHNVRMRALHHCGTCRANQHECKEAPEGECCPYCTHHEGFLRSEQQRRLPAQEGPGSVCPPA